MKKYILYILVIVLIIDIYVQTNHMQRLSEFIAQPGGSIASKSGASQLFRIFSPTLLLIFCALDKIELIKSGLFCYMFFKWYISFILAVLALGNASTWGDFFNGLHAQIWDHFSFIIIAILVFSQWRLRVNFLAHEGIVVWWEEK